MNKPRIKGLELCCGKKSFTKSAEKKGIRMITNDIDERFNPDLSCDYRNLKWYMFRGYKILWASPDCRYFSVASIGTHWKGGKCSYTPKSVGCRSAINDLHYLVSMISKMLPIYWFIENPRGVMRKVIEPLFEKYGMNDYIRRTVTYCQYGDERMKPTDIWTNLKSWEPKPMCKNGDKCHVEARRGAKTGTQGRKGSIDRSRIPDDLCNEIVEAILDAER